MIVVADTGPVHYLVLIEAIDVLHALYDRVFVPAAVAIELQQTSTPGVVRNWIAHTPPWCEIRQDLPFEPALGSLDPGERAAILLALSCHAERLLIDDWAGRSEALRRGLRVTGTLGILAEAHEKHLFEFETALARLRQTNFYLSDELVSRVRRFLSGH